MATNLNKTTDTEPATDTEPDTIPATSDEAEIDFQFDEAEFDDFVYAVITSTPVVIAPDPVLIQSLGPDQRWGFDENALRDYTGMMWRAISQLEPHDIGALVDGLIPLLTPVPLPPYNLPRI